MTCVQGISGNTNEQLLSLKTSLSTHYVSHTVSSTEYSRAYIQYVPVQACSLLFLITPLSRDYIGPSFLVFRFFRHSTHTHRCSVACRIKVRWNRGHTYCTCTREVRNMRRCDTNTMCGAKSLDSFRYGQLQYGVGHDEQRRYEEM